MRHVTNDEAWGVVERGHDYHFQFEGNWVNLHPDRVLVGRAVTVRMVPLRPDCKASSRVSALQKAAAVGRTLGYRHPRSR
jgi:hypothetical protein